MRALNQYSPAEWLRADPLVHGFKRLRNEAIERTFRARRSGDLDRFLSDHAASAKAQVSFAVAYNTPWTIDLLTRAAARQLAGPLVIADNSRDPAAREVIRRLCDERGVGYVGLPWNPERHPCRSHGLAMGWIYDNIVLAWRPEVFAYLDHDLFPLAPLDPAAKVGEGAVYGLRRQSRYGWTLWAGYSMFRLAAIERFRPSFNHDIPNDLDTGGRNWTRIYRHLDPAAAHFAHEGYFDVRDPKDGSLVRLSAMDEMIHFGGAAYASPRSPAENAALFARLIESGSRERRFIEPAQPVSA